MQSEGALLREMEGRAEGAAGMMMHWLQRSCSSCNCLHYKAIISVQNSNSVLKVYMPGGFSFEEMFLLLYLTA